MRSTPDIEPTNALGAERLAELQRLATHPEASSRQVAAWDADTPLRLLEMLADDDDPNVRAAVAENPVAPSELIERIEARSASENSDGESEEAEVGEQRQPWNWGDAIQDFISSAVTGT